MATSNMAISISCNNYNGRPLALILENVSDSSITDNSTITTHPIPSGETVSDSMFKRPVTMSISGAFGTSYSANQELTTRGLMIDGDATVNIATLEDVEVLFTNIKNQGLLCDIVRLKLNNDGSTKFLVRQSMALQSITWTEKINTVSFNFSFQQVMKVEVDEDYDVNMSDENLPDVYPPVSTKFTDTFFDTNQVVAITTQILKENKLVTSQFLEVLSSYTSAALAGIVGGAAAVLATVILAGITSGGVLLVVGVIVLAGVFLYKFISDMVKMSKSKIHVFKKYVNKKKTEEEIKRYVELESDILQEFQDLNNKISIFQISKNASHQAVLTIDDQLWWFNFSRNNVNNSYGLSILVENEDGDVVKVDNSKIIEDVKAFAVSSIDDCNDGTMIASTKTGYELYLLNIPKEGQERTNDLTEYYIMISSIKMSEYYKMMTETISNYLLR